MRVAIPAGFHDVTKLREVPDNQEVFADADSDQSFIFELLQVRTSRASRLMPSWVHGSLTPTSLTRTAQSITSLRWRS